MELRRQQRVAEHCFHQGVSLWSFVRGFRKSRSPTETEGADPCRCVSPSLLLQHRSKVASWTPNHHPPLPFALWSCPAAWLRPGSGEATENPWSSPVPLIPGASKAPGSQPYLGASRLQRPRAAAAGPELPSCWSWLLSSCREAAPGVPSRRFYGGSVCSWENH